MSLFVINRFQSGEDENSDHGDNHLLELQKRIEDRKRQKELAASDCNAISTNISKESGDIANVTKKKKRINKQDRNVSDLDVIQNATSLVEKIAKVNGYSDLDDFESLTNTITEEQQGKKKKKKRSKVTTVGEVQDEPIGDDNETAVLQADVIENQVNDLIKKKKKEENVSIEGLEHDDLLKAKGKLEELAQNLHETDDDSEGERQNFTVLKAGKHMKEQVVKRVLPEWLANPEVVSSNLNSGPSFKEFQESGQLDPKIIEVLKSQGFTKLFPVQARLLTWLLKCNEDRKKGLWSRDTCVSAPTGSGKTLAYVLPIIEILRTRFIRKIRCLIVLPVQELATQVYNVVRSYASHSKFEHTRLKVGLVSGAASFEKEQESLVSKDRSGNSTSQIDILVATPRRLIDHIHRTAGFTLNDLQFLVIDEADRETSDWIQELPLPHSKAPVLTLNNMLNNPIPAQKLLFSATLSQDPEKLSRLGLFHPILYTTAIIRGRDDDVNLDKEFEEGNVGRYSSPSELTMKSIECAEEYKPLAVYHLLTNTDLRTNKALVFTNSCNSVHRLTLIVKSLLNGQEIAIAELSGQLNSKKREQEYQKFLHGETQVLICSDVLARGVDIPRIKLVISYDPPKHMRALIHRAGRTGRAGVPGTAVFILISRQVPLFKKLFTEAKWPAPDIKVKDFGPLAEDVDYQGHAENLKNSLDRERINSFQKRKIHKKT